MKRALSIWIVAVAGFAASTASINFDAAAAGALPAGWTSAMTGRGGPPKWEIREDNTAPSKPKVLAQVSDDNAAGRFPLAILNSVTCRDGELSAAFKPVSGKVDQAAGLVWRYRDPNTYYLVRANALEDNIVLYKVENGRRSSLAPQGTPAKTYGVKHKVPSNLWSTLGVTFQGNQFTVFFNGEKLFQVEDKTFTEAGKTGLWTKADSVTYFDDFRVEPK